MAEIISIPAADSPLLVEDTLARSRALDIRHSFIVQAPAGSGKTSLLTQRFLALLATVDRLPEEILALTFTRKAAGEMRDRILNILHQAKVWMEGEESEYVSDRKISEKNGYSEKSGCSEKNDFEKLTLALAKKVLERDKVENWEILLNPKRLKIQTLDALCAGIVSNLPLASGISVDVKMVDDPRPLYSEASKRLLKHMECEETWSQAVRALVFYLDNNLLWAEKLLTEILQHREQWLPYIGAIETGEGGRKILEQSLKWVVEENLGKVSELASKDQKSRWLSLLNYSRKNLKNKADLETADLETQEYSVESGNDLKFWLALADLFLTEENLTRKTVTQKQGFPAPSAALNAEEKNYFKEMKEQMLSVLQELENFPEFCEALVVLRLSPPLFYSDTQWKILDALLQVLPVLTAELICVFQENNLVDFAEIAMTASRLLGESERPSDLALGFDYRIRHLLVDEFQDTSIAQFRLLKKFTQGWQNEDGRTVFFVGDPQQSIYRFRQAEVGIFLKVKARGFGEKKVFPLYLGANFRSCPQIIDWVNQYFSKRFPKVEDQNLGAVPYRFSQYIHDHANNTNTINTIEEAGVRVQLVSEDSEAECLVKYLEELRLQQTRDVHQSIALLVRSRSHLQKILPVLRAQQIPFQGIELDPLKDSQVIQDLLSLTRAVLHLGDRIAWLAVLRGPCFQFSLQDLECIACFEADLPIFWALENFQSLEGLSAKAKSTLESLFPFLREAVQQLGKQTVYQIIKKLWVQLKGDHYLDENELEEAQQFFNTLETLPLEEAYFPNKLEEKLNALYANSSHSESDYPILQIMTIHKAKGLEFDTVILAGSQRRTRSDSERLLLWKEMTGKTKQDSYLLLAPIRSVAEQEDAIYHYLKWLHKRAADYEAERLLYVAATRARRQLFILKHRD